MIQHLLAVDPAGDMAERPKRQPDVLGGELGMTLRQGDAGSQETLMGGFEGAAVALAGDDRVTVAEGSSEERRDAVEEGGQAGAGLGRNREVDGTRGRRGEI